MTFAEPLITPFIHSLVYHLFFMQHSLLYHIYYINTALINNILEWVRNLKPSVSLIRRWPATCPFILPHSMVQPLLMSMQSESVLVFMVVIRQQWPLTSQLFSELLFALPDDVWFDLCSKEVTTFTHAISIFQLFNWVLQYLSDWFTTISHHPTPI